MLTGYWHLAPEALVVIGALAALFGEFLPGRDKGAAYLAAALAAVAALLVAFGGTAGAMAFGQIQPDGIARFARVSVAGLTALWALWVAGRGMRGERRRDAIALAMFAAAGGMLLSMAQDLIVMYIALELSTMPAYILMGYRRDDVRGLEGALKYFLLSMLTSVIMLYGLSFVYGVSGTTAFAEISLEAAGTLGLVAVLLTLVGLLAKMSAAPFHYWAPDAYAGAQPAAVAFVSTVPKIAGITVMARILSVVAPQMPELAPILSLAAAASMVLGNFAALPQTDLRRLMAYSGVAHTGYVLMALAAGPPIGYRSAVFYAVAYAVPSMAIMLLAAEEHTDVTGIGGLSSRRPWLAWFTVVWLLSLIGIPPLAGFFGKLYLFSAAVSGSSWVLLVIALLTSVVSAGYYFRIIRAAFLGERPPAEDEGENDLSTESPAAVVALTGLVVVVILMGVGVSPILRGLGVPLG
ncbi:MAG: NADH-quinone oxidoreductase subunit N [Coriobacteriia bacterium]|jgi:NADH-quinone oxidoreductase subunit N|nr:NADH-quinone oxidoreductase subunit N [Coriobacteriia bacterium]